MAKKKKKSSDSYRTFHVMRFTASDKETLYDYFCGFDSRHKALLALVPIVESMIEEHKKNDEPKTHAVRLGLPKDFITAARRLDRPMTKTIIQAAKRSIAARKSDSTSESPLPQSGEVKK